MLRVLIFALALLPMCSTLLRSATITEQLSQMGSTRIVSEAMSRGNAMRGAVLFHQAHVQCSKCHSVTEGASPLGPNLSDYPAKPERTHLVESMLAPSKTIREGYQTVSALTDDGLLVTGILVSQNATQIVLRDASSDGKQITLAKADLEESALSDKSIMPEGMMDQLESTSQFLDLARYVIEVAEQGPARAAELAPPASSMQPPPLPEYESHVDHAGIIESFDEASFDRGAKIYNRVCANCHGTHEQEGTLPTAPRFANGKLKNGSDPYRLYQTLTHGVGLMVAQRWMVPQQKYDVIHFLREEYFREDNKALYAKIDKGYLQGLPQGDTRGPEATVNEPYITMNYGNSLNHTYEIQLNNDGKNAGVDLGRGPRTEDPWANPDDYFAPGTAPNYAYKGIAVRLNEGAGGVTQGSHWVVYDHDTMNMQAAWEGSGFIDYACIQFDGRHGVHNRLKGKIHFENPVGPGWGQPLTEVFYDPRPVGRDGRPYGPLPRSWAKYKGLYHHGFKTIISYSVGGADILEQPSFIREAENTVFVRNLTIGPAAHRLNMRIAPDDKHARVMGHGESSIESVDGYLTLKLGPRDNAAHLRVLVSEQPITLDTEAMSAPEDLTQFTHGGKPRWTEKVHTVIETVHNEIFAVDEITLPRANPWNCQVRATGHDFFADKRRAAVCMWDGDVWIVDGVDQGQGELTWQRIASGMFQPLGLKIVDEQIFVTCRDQLVVLRDLNGDLETDFYECFNNDHQVTEHFHEFAMGLQADDKGNFYYAKSGRHAKRAVVPHHGTLLRIAPDGSKTDIIATGFRAANGVCLNPDGSFFVTDQEGHWNPKNRINWVTEGGFYGNMYSFTEATDPSDDAMIPPMCWITNSFDRSPAELLWVPKNMWGPFGGSLLNLSYGYGQVYIVPHEKVNGQLQGGMSPLPIPKFPSGLVRGRFHPERSELFLCSMFSWAGSQQSPGGFHRVRYSGRPAHLPIGLSAMDGKVNITFSHPINTDSASEEENFTVKVWDLRRTPNYGSKHYNERQLVVKNATISEDGHVVSLTLPELAPTWGMSIEYQLEGADGRVFKGEIHNSIYNLRKDSRVAFSSRNVDVRRAK